MEVVDNIQVVTLVRGIVITVEEGVRIVTRIPIRQGINRQRYQGRLRGSQ